jgi:dephospho-CoA kinase
MDRDNVVREKVLERIQNQMSDDEKLKLCNYVIYNDNKHSVIKQVLLLHQLFIS